MRGRRCAVRVVLAAVLLLVATACAGDPPPSWQSQPDGTVLGSSPLPPERWIPGTTATAFRLTYVSRDAHGQKAQVTGQMFIPRGQAPPGGWKVISWAHGTSGQPDGCAPSVRGPAEAGRDLPYLARWMQEGYAVVASDYVGLGTPGYPAYLNGASEAHNVVDMVRAGHDLAASTLPPPEQLSRQWVAIGQSQGGGAAIYTARYATEFGGPDLDYRGAVGTGVPAYIENVLSTVGPGAPPTPDPSGFVAYYLTSILASLDSVHPELGVGAALTPYGHQQVDVANSGCVDDAGARMKGVVVGQMLDRPLASLPNWRPTVDDYLKMPETGFDKPFFMGHGLRDADVPYAITAPYVATLMANRQPLTFRTYPTDHSGALIASQQDAIPFVRGLF